MPTKKKLPRKTPVVHYGNSTGYNWNNNPFIDQVEEMVKRNSKEKKVYTKKKSLKEEKNG